MRATDYRFIDIDSHCYETRDSFSRHIPEQYADATVHPVEGDDGRERPYIGDDLVTFVDSEVYGKVGRPGSLGEMLRRMKEGQVEDAYQWEDPLPEYLERDARLAVLDEQGVEACLLFPSVALTVEQYMGTDDHLYANFHSFNRWYEEVWGFNHENRIFAPPWISLRNLDRAVQEVEWALEHGARIVQMRTGPAYGRSPGDPYFDPVWARLNEANASVAFHLTHPGYNAAVSELWGENPNPPVYHQTAWQWCNLYGERPVMDTLSSLIYANLFARFPNLMVASVENGCEWMPYLIRRMDKMRGMGRNGPWIGGQLPERPSEIFKRHVVVTPYPEDDVMSVIDKVGSDSIVLGSDWPHPEGLKEPADFLDTLASLSDDEVRKIMRDNGSRLLRLAS